MSAPASPFDLGGVSQLTREELAAMSPAERLAAHKAGHTEDVIGRKRDGLFLGVLGVDAATLATMTPEAILSAAKATHESHQDVSAPVPLVLPVPQVEPPVYLQEGAQLTRKELAAMSPAERLAAHKAGHTEDVTQAGGRRVADTRRRTLTQMFGVDMATFEAMSPEARLDARSPGTTYEQRVEASRARPSSRGIQQIA